MKKTTFLLASAALSLAATTQAAEVSTTPVGYSTWTINAGNGTTRAVTTLALPLYQPTSSTDGAASGVIASVSTNTITVTGAGWTTGELSDPATPYCVRITSGAAEGRNLLVSTAVSNTSDTLTIDNNSSGVSDLTALGIVASTDTFELVECDTLSSLFGAPTTDGIVGGENYQSADNLLLFVNGAWAKFYYNTNLGRWTKQTFGSPDASNQPVLPDSGLLYSRKADQVSEFVITGTVPNTARRLTINDSGVTFLGSAWPVDLDLSSSGFETIPEWQSSAAFADADKVFVYNGSSWQKYFHDGANWRKITFGTPVADSDVIVAGSAVIVVKENASSSDMTLVQNLPYTL